MTRNSSHCKKSKHLYKSFLRIRLLDAKLTSHLATLLSCVATLRRPEPWEPALDSFPAHLRPVCIHAFPNICRRDIGGKGQLRWIWMLRRFPILSYLHPTFVGWPMQCPDTYARSAQNCSY